MKFLVSILASLAMMLPAQANDVPAELRGKTVTIVVPYAAGGNSDTWFRMLARQVTANTGQAINILNRPGAMSNIGTAEVATARANGLTLLGTDSTSLVLNPLMNIKGSSNKYQFSTITVNLVTTQGIYVAPDSKYRTLKDLIVDLRVNSKKLNYGCSYALCQISMARILDYFKIDMPVIPYNSTPQLLTDVIGGTLTFAPSDPTALSMARGGKIRALAFGSEQPVAGFPSVGLYKDVVPGFVVENFLGLYAPADTPSHIVTYFNRVFRDAANAKDIQETMAQRGSRTLDLDVSGSDAYVARALHIWKPLVDKYYRSEN